MPRAHGYSLRGHCCYGKRDWHAKGRTNAFGAIIGFTFLTVSLFESMINSNVFYAWLTQDLLPSGSVIVMDNASFHKRRDMMIVIERQGCLFEFLPLYSLDLNPIEHKWAQVKATRKRLDCSVDVDELFAQYSDYINLFIVIQL